VSVDLCPLLPAEQARVIRDGRSAYLCERVLDFDQWIDGHSSTGLDSGRRIDAEDVAS
jgi:hypothetical protein